MPLKDPDRRRAYHREYMTDFDHVAGDKVDDLCNLRRRTANWEKILAEVAKCDLVCANCHRARTHYRRLGQVPPMTILAQAFGDPRRAWLALAVARAAQ